MGGGGGWARTSGVWGGEGGGVGGGGGAWPDRHGNVRANGGGFGMGVTVGRWEMYVLRSYYYSSCMVCILWY